MVLSTPGPSRRHAILLILLILLIVVLVGKSFSRAFTLPWLASMMDDEEASRKKYKESGHVMPFSRAASNNMIIVYSSSKAALERGAYGRYVGTHI